MIECVNAILDMFGNMVSLLLSLELPGIGTSFGAVLLSISLIAIVGRALLKGVLRGVGSALNNSREKPAERDEND